jgi:hypothetical protein
LNDCIQAGEKDAMQCFQDARTCFMNRLPPRCDQNGGAGTGGTATAGAGGGAGGN